MSAATVIGALIAWVSILCTLALGALACLGVLP